MAAIMEYTFDVYAVEKLIIMLRKHKFLSLNESGVHSVMEG